MRTKEIPARISPPWSTLTAYDLNKGTIKWQVPFGNAPELAAEGIGGTGNLWPRNGVVVTGGGLIFAASRSEGNLRAYDEDTGKVLWETQMPAG
jgi:quinoprotein glucose dehydrogenase